MSKPESAGRESGGDASGPADFAGPVAYANWRAARAGLPRKSGYEVALGSDVAGGTGQATAADLNGPYEIFNTLAQAVPAPSIPPPPLVLRIWFHDTEARSPSSPEPPRPTTTDTSGYHGGDIADELASFLSLALSVRLWPGEMSRLFVEGSPHGTPMAAPPPPIPPRRGLSPRPQVPRLKLNFQLDARAIQRLRSYPDLGPEQSVALARAARAYALAIWLTESQPELSWILLVAAIEAAANFEDPKSDGRTTRRAVEFCIKYRPTSGPCPQPQCGGFAWDDDNVVRCAVRRVWALRGQALHEGVPFPPPMCSPPLPAPQGYAPEEVPLGLATHALGGSWQHGDVPFLLHAFEYLVSHALLNWWDSMTAAAASVARP